MTLRSDSMVSMPSPAAMTSIGHPEADAMPEQMTHCPPRRVDRRLALTRRVEPGAMRAGDLAAKVGDGGDQGWPSLGRRIGIGAVIAARMEAQRADSMQGW